MLMFVFPGQGSQAVGMGKEICENFPVARDVFMEVDDTLRFKLSNLMFEGDLHELTKTQHAQPAIMAVSMAILRVIEHELGKKITDIANFVAGHSLGEYSALCGVDFFSVRECAKLLQKRAFAMNNAVQNSENFGMLAILGVDLQKAEEVVATINKEIGFCEIANDNENQQVIFSCEKKVIDFLTQNYRKYGIKRVVPLNVSAPFHCSLMKPAGRVMQDELMKIADLQDLRIPILQNVNPQPTTNESEIIEGLVRQTYSRVRFRETIENAWELGVRKFVEIGHGKVLSSLIKKIKPEAAILTINSVDSINNFIE